MEFSGSRKACSTGRSCTPVSEDKSSRTSAPLFHRPLPLVHFPTEESLARARTSASLEEERRFLEHVKAEMHLHATYAKAAELSKQVDTFSPPLLSRLLMSLSRLLFSTKRTREGNP